MNCTYVPSQIQITEFILFPQMRKNKHVRNKIFLHVVTSLKLKYDIVSHIQSYFTYFTCVDNSYVNLKYIRQKRATGIINKVDSRQQSNRVGNKYN